MAAPENPIIRGELISEGICSGSVFVVHGDKETVEPGNIQDELQKNMIITAGIDDMANPYPRVRNPSSEYDLDQPDTGFQWLDNQNTLLLDYSHPDRLLHRCLSPENCLKLSMAANRNQLFANLQGEINDFIEDTRHLLEGCQQFLQPGLNNSQPPSLLVTSKLLYQ